MDILDLLRADGSIVINKHLAHEIGLNEALVYSELVSMYKYWASKGMLKDGEWFFCTIENLEENTTLKKDKQSRAISNLEKKYKLIETKRMGLPAKRYFRITNQIYGLFANKFSQKQKTDSDKGLEGESEQEGGSNPHGYQISQKQKTRSREMRNQGFAKTDTNNTKYNNTKINNTNTYNYVCEEEKEILDLIEKREDIKKDTHTEIINLLDKLKEKSNFRYDIFKDTLEIVDFDIYDINYFKAAINGNMKKGYVRKIEDKPLHKKEVVPDWFENRKKETSYVTDYSKYNFKGGADSNIVEFDLEKEIKDLYEVLENHKRKAN